MSAARRAGRAAVPLASALVLMCAGGSGAQQQPPAVRARLAVERAGEMWTFAVQLESDSSARVEYRLHTAVDGASGRSQNRQSGAARLLAGQAQQPSRSTVRIRPGDRYCVTLSVLEGERLIASDRVSSDAPPADLDGVAIAPSGPAPCED